MSRWISICVIFSGFGGLLYHVVWQRLLGFFAGGEIVAATIVVAAFLTGLGVGTSVASQFADRLSARRALLYYGIAEVSIGLFGVFSKFIFYDVVFVYFRSYDFSLGITYIILFMCMLVPTFLMGTTLPLLSRLFSTDILSAAKNISFINGMNILGSVLGCFVSGWFLIGYFGYEVSLYIGASINVIAGIFAFILQRQIPDATVALNKPSMVTDHVVHQPIHSAVPYWCLATFISGFLAISLEILWFHLLDLYIKSNSYLFAHLLGFVLLGYALGNMLGSKWIHRIKNARLVFWILQALVIGYFLFSNFILVECHKQIAALLRTSIYNQQQQDFASYLTRYVFLPIIFLLPPNILVGIGFPIIQKALQDQADQIGRRVGAILTFNIIGNVCGATATGLILLHYFGTIHTLFFIGLIGCGVLFYIFNRFSKSEFRLATGFKALLLLIMASLSAYFLNDSARYRQLHEVSTEQKFIYAEDSSGLSSLVEFEKNSYHLFYNLSPEGYLPFKPFHVHLGALPALVHPKPETALVIGLGSGATSFGIGIEPSLRSILTIELITSQESVLGKAATLPEGIGLKLIFSDPRFNIKFADGRKYLATTKEQFDIIEIDAIRPRESHSGILYSREFYEEVKLKLKPGGIFTQWAATPRVLATLRHVFNFTVDFNGEVILASMEPIELNKDAVLRRLRQPEALAHLRAGLVDSREFELWIQNAQVQHWTPEQRIIDLDINTDLKPKDEFYLNN